MAGQSRSSTVEGANDYGASCCFLAVARCRQISPRPAVANSESSVGGRLDPNRLAGDDGRSRPQWLSRGGEYPWEMRGGRVGCSLRSAFSTALSLADVVNCFSTTKDTNDTKIHFGFRVFGVFRGCLFSSLDPLHQPCHVVAVVRLSDFLGACFRRQLRMAGRIGESCCFAASHRSNFRPSWRDACSVGLEMSIQMSIQMLSGRFGDA